MRTFSTFGLVAGAALLAMATPSLAETVVLDLSNSGTAVNSQVRVFSATSGSATVNVRASAWTLLNGTTLARARLDSFSEGLGVTNSQDGGPNSHTVDNVGSFDFILFQFDQAVEIGTGRLRTFQVVNYTSGDNDSTINVFNSNASWMTTLTGANVALALASTEYSLSGVGSSQNWTYDLNPGDLTGNVWLIGADRSGMGSYRDGFKLDKLTVSTVLPPVPEPATWALMIGGLGLVGGALRRRPRRGAAAA